MLQRIIDFFSLKGEFRLPKRTSVPNGKVRAITEEDFERCEEIYKLNEAKHFPPGYFPHFSAWLREGHAFVVGIEQSGVVQAFGGINLDIHQDRQVAFLTFGMVHPSQHKNGLGTALLMSRLALLRHHTNPTFACLSTAGGSESFYGRFGFKFMVAEQTSPDYLQKTYYVRVSSEDASMCHAALKSLSAPSGFFELEIPPASKLKTSEERVNA